MRDQGASVSKPGELFWRSWKDGTISLYCAIGHSGDDTVMLRLFLKMKPQDLLKADRNPITISTKIVQIDTATEWLERISSAQ